VIFVRNNGSEGEPDETGTPGWHIHPAVSPKDSELIIDKEGANAFSGTDLHTELTHRNVEQIVLAGMQTEMCVAATVKEAAKRGFSVILVKDGHTTFDWDELTAVEAIEKHNHELAKIAMLQNAQDVNF
jgi:nicotinamidase-related amidase